MEGIQQAIGPLNHLEGKDQTLVSMVVLDPTVDRLSGTGGDEGDRDMRASRCAALAGVFAIESIGKRFVTVRAMQHMTLRVDAV